jgi:hypothetical protein
MTKIKPGMEILTIGFGYGYLETIFSEVAENKADIYSIERDASILSRGKKIIEKLGYTNFTLRLGDGFKIHWKDKKFDVIWATLSCKKIPMIWVKQLKEGGFLGIFRALTRDEFNNAKKVGWEGYAGQVKDYSRYLSRWWKDVCLSIYKKEHDELIEISRLYEADNPPFFNEKYGVARHKAWGKEYGQEYERKLLAILNSEIRNGNPQL